MFSTQDPLASRSINGSSPVQGWVLSPGVPSPSPGFGAVPQGKEKPQGHGEELAVGLAQDRQQPKSPLCCAPWALEEVSNSSESFEEAAIIRAQPSRRFLWPLPWVQAR